MVIQIIPKKEEKSLPLENALFYVSIALLIAALASFIIINIFQQKTEKEIKSLDEQSAALLVSSEAALGKEVLVYQKKIDDFSSLLSSYKYTSQLFPLIERLTHPQVSFYDFSLDANQKTLGLSGETDSFKTLDQQLFIFKNEKSINGVQVSDIAFGKEGRISFHVNLVLDQQVFTKIKNNE